MQGGVGSGYATAAADSKRNIVNAPYLPVALRSAIAALAVFTGSKALSQIRSMVHHMPAERHMRSQARAYLAANMLYTATTSMVAVDKAVPPERPCPGTLRLVLCREWTYMLGDERCDCWPAAPGPNRAQGYQGAGAAHGLLGLQPDLEARC